MVRSAAASEVSTANTWDLRRVNLIPELRWHACWWWRLSYAAQHIAGECNTSAGGRRCGLAHGRGAYDDGPHQTEQQTFDRHAVCLANVRMVATMLVMPVLQKDATAAEVVTVRSLQPFSQKSRTPTVAK